MAVRGRLTQKDYVYWTRAELDLLSDAWAKGGLKAAREALPGRSDDSLRGKAHSLGVTIAGRKKHERYKPSEFVDAAIRRAYLDGRPNLAELSKCVNRPRDWLKWRAGELGVRRQLAGGGAVWTDMEDAIVTEGSDAGLSITAIQARLKRAGFGRSVGAVGCRVVALKIGFSRNWWSANEVGELFGIDAHVVVRWIQAGLLRATRKSGNSNRSPTDERIKMHAIQPDDVRRFMIENPSAWDHRKMRKEVLLDMLCPSAMNTARTNRGRIG